MPIRFLKAKTTYSYISLLSIIVLSHSHFNLKSFAVHSLKTLTISSNPLGESSMASSEQGYTFDTHASIGPTEVPLRFRDLQNEIIFAELERKQVLCPWIINTDTTALGIKCIKQMKSAGLEELMKLREEVYPKIVKEFYSNLQFEEGELKAKFYLRGISGTLTEKSLAEILECSTYAHSIRIFDHVYYEGYDQVKACQSLTGGKSEIKAVGDMDIDAQIMYHILCHVIAPRAYQLDSVLDREIFYMWCIRNDLHMNIPFIILSHMKSFLKGEIRAIPYGMLITRIARQFGIYVSNQQKLIFSKERCCYNDKFFNKMGFFRKEKGIDESKPLPKRRKRSVSTMAVSGINKSVIASSQTIPIIDIKHRQIHKGTTAEKKTQEGRKTVSTMSSEIISFEGEITQAEILQQLRSGERNEDPVSHSQKVAVKEVVGEDTNKQETETVPYMPPELPSVENPEPVLDSHLSNKGKEIIEEAETEEASREKVVTEPEIREEAPEGVKTDQERKTNPLIHGMMLISSQIELSNQRALEISQKLQRLEETVCELRNSVKEIKEELSAKPAPPPANPETEMDDPFIQLAASVQIASTPLPFTSPSSSKPSSK